MKSNQCIAVTIQNFVQYYSIKAGIDALIGKGYPVDIYVPTFEENKDGYNSMYEAIYKHLEGLHKYNLKREYNDKKYKVVLSPYDMGIFYQFKTDYHIKYKYAVSAKPKLTLTPKDNILYDGILCYSSWEREILKVYAPTYQIGNLKFVNFKKNNKKHKKPYLLYLPTYGKYSSISAIDKDLKKLKEKYHIIVKMHHGTTYLQKEVSEKEKIIDTDYEIYDETYDLTLLLEKADIVITDNSGSIFEAMYAGVPVLLFSGSNNDLSLGNLIPLQQQLVNQKVLLSCNDTSQLENFIKKTRTKEVISKQKKMRDELFPVSYSKLIPNFVQVIEKYLFDEINRDYYCLHKVFVEDYKFLYEKKPLLEKEINDLKVENEKNLYNNKQLKNEIDFLKEELSNYQNGKLYRVATKIYSVLYQVRLKLKGGKKNERG